MIAAHLDPVWTAPVQQRCYRSILQAWAYPGRIVRLPVEDALLATMATLVDDTVTICDRDAVLAPAELHRSRGQVVPFGEAQFIGVDGACPPGETAPLLGNLLRPDRSATLLLRVRGLECDGPLLLRGPGINGQQRLAVAGLDPAWWAARRLWCGAYPLGVDILMCARNTVVAIPRTTLLEGY